MKVVVVGVVAKLNPSPESHVNHSAIIVNLIHWRVQFIIFILLGIHYLPAEWLGLIIVIIMELTPFHPLTHTHTHTGSVSGMDDKGFVRFVYPPFSITIIITCIDIRGTVETVISVQEWLLRVHESAPDSDWVVVLICGHYISQVSLFCGHSRSTINYPCIHWLLLLLLLLLATFVIRDD